MGLSCDLVFPLPPQGDDISGNKRSRLEIFRETLENLPFGDMERAAQELFNVLYKTNRMVLSQDERLSLLQLLEEPSFHVLAGLQGKIKDLAAPISRKEERIAKVLVGAHFELALSYRCLLEKPPVKGVLRTPCRETMANYLRFSIYHLGEVLRTKYNAMNNPGGAVWKYVYTLFVCAYEQDIHTISLPSLPWCRYVSVEDVFKSVVLLAMSSPLTMRGSDFNALYELAPELTPYIELGKIKCGESYEKLSTFNLSQTEPPKQQIMSGCVSCGNASNCFALSTKPLLSLFNEQLELAKTNSKPTPIQRFLTQQYQLDNLLRNLGGLEKTERSERIDGAGLSVELVAGFGVAHASLRSDESQHSVSVDDGLALEGEDEWESDITLSSTDSWTNTGILGPEQRRVNCKVINHSSGGYCLSIDAKKKFRLWVGELSLVRGSNSESWRPAAISWVSSGKDRIDFGIKLIAEKAEAGSLMPNNYNSVDAVTDCLILSGSDNKSSEYRVVTASPDFDQGDTFLLKLNGDESKLTVSRRESKTSGYTEYRCESQEVSQQDTATTAAGGDQADYSKTGADLEVDFDSLWSEL
jgi:cyclic-di-GMP-binding protein